MLFIIQIF